MVNHPNRKSVYRIQTLHGKFDHVAGLDAAINRAKEMINLQPIFDVPGSTTVWLHRLEYDWGVTITRVSPEIARSVGL